MSSHTIIAKDLWSVVGREPCQSVHGYEFVYWSRRGREEKKKGANDFCCRVKLADVCGVLGTVSARSRHV